MKYVRAIPAVSEQNSQVMWMALCERCAFKHSMKGIWGKFEGPFFYNMEGFLMKIFTLNIPTAAGFDSLKGI